MLLCWRAPGNPGTPLPGTYFSRLERRAMSFRPMTVVQMLPDLESGGVERGTLELGAFLVRQGHRSLVVSGGGRLVPQLEEEGSRHISLPVGKKTPQCIGCIPRLRQLLLAQRVDILHLRSRVPAWVALVALKTLSKNQRPRVVTTFHGFYSINKFSAVMAKGERVIAVSHIISDHIQSFYGIPKERIRVIHRGVDPALFDPSNVSTKRRDALWQKWGIPDTEGVVILMPARITRLKGHDLLIRSLGRIKHLPWTAVFTGDLADNPSYAGELQSQIESLRLGDRIKLVGHCDDMPAALLISDVVVSASGKPESFGRIAVEAQAMARPVIATAHGGSLETVQDRTTGWLVPPGDEAAFAKALETALSQPDVRRTYGQNGRQRVRQQFTVENMCRATLNVYQELLGAVREPA